jgi:hypothetical protein
MHNVVLLDNNELGRLRMRWEDNSKLDLRKMGCVDEMWMELAQDCVQWWALVVWFRFSWVPQC